MNLKLGDIAEQFQLECRGDADTQVSGIAGLQEAKPGQLSFLFNTKLKHLLSTTRASGIVLRPADATGQDCPLLLADNPRLAWARIATLFDTLPISMPFLHPSAVVSDGATLGQKVAIGANVVVRAGACIGEGAIIGPGCQIGEGSVVGAGSRLFPNVVLYHDVCIGEGCILHAGAVLGSDGFGFEFDPAKGDYVKIPQVYGVRIGHRVEIGAGTTIDRGALNHTSIGDDCKLDSQVHVGHGTTIGHHTVISGCSAIAGSTRIGSYCLLGGGAGVIDNIQIVDRVEITAMTLVSRSILKQGRYSSGTGLMAGYQWKRSVAGFRQLGDIIKRLRHLEAGYNDGKTK